MKTMLIKNGHLIDPRNGVDGPRDLLLQDGRVAAVGAPGTLKIRGGESVDAKGAIVAPGLIDMHVHLREPGQRHKETIASGTAAARAGGFTTVACMPNTVPVNDAPAITRWMQHRDRGARVSVLPVAAATLGSQGAAPTDFAALKAAGAVAVSDDGRPILDDWMMEQVLRRARKAGLPVIQHAEDTRRSHGCTIHAGATAFRLGLHGMPAEAEASIVARDLQLLARTGGHLHVAHISTRLAVAAVRKAKRAGLRVTCEATPHHFTLLDEHIGDHDTRFKMCPPLRAAADREALLAGLADGTIDCIATDHAPHAAHEKSVEFERAPNGIIGLETAVGLTLQVLHHHHGLALRRIIALLSSAPAEVLGLADRGHLGKGARADVTLIEPDKEWTFFAADAKSQARNTPFDGWKFRGRVARVVTAGGE